MYDSDKQFFKILGIIGAVIFATFTITTTIIESLEHKFLMSEKQINLQIEEINVKLNNKLDLLQFEEFKMRYNSDQQRNIHDINLINYVLNQRGIFYGKNNNKNIKTN